VEKRTPPDKLTFRFEKDPGYRIVPVNGVWGGPTIRGDVRVDLFYEHQALPEEAVQRVTPEGTLADAEGLSPTQLVRTVMVTMMLTAEQADSIGEWLKQKAQLIRAAKEAQDADRSAVKH